MNTNARSARRHAPAFALVVTLIMVTLAAVIVVTLLSSASLDRATANSFSKRLRAEMAAQSGLAAALNALSGATGPNDFRFVTVVGDGATGPLDSQPALIPLTYAPATGNVSLDLPNKRPLVSITPTGGPSPVPTPATLTLSSAVTPHITRKAGPVLLTTKDSAGNDQEAGRYAFYVDEASSRQNVVAQGGSSRVYARDPSELPVVTTAANPVPFSTSQIADLKSITPLLLTVPTANAAPTSGFTPPADDYSYTTASAITNLTPEGKSKLNLTRLKAYVDGLAIDQTANNARSQLVNRLLDPNEQGVEWGPDPSTNQPGGNLAFLRKLSHYSSDGSITTQCKQIVANLLDYLDDDLVPTTDNADNPTYFGVEGKDLGNGTWVGHPYINFVGTGLVFNRGTTPPGELNSTRVLVFLGIVNPWSAPTKDWRTFYVQPEMDVTINGTASAPPGLLGTNASAYFLRTFSVDNYSTPGDNHLIDCPSWDGTISPRTGYVLPHTMSGGQYNNYNLIHQPTGMTFTNLTFTINKLRLKFKSTNGQQYVVQVLDRLNTMTQPMSQTTISMGTGTTALVYRLGATGDTTKTDFHLNCDPRLNFFVSDPQNSATKWWLLSKSTASTSPDAAPPPVPNPTSGINVFISGDLRNDDFPSPTPSSNNYSWYTKPDITANFYVRSPSKEPRDSTDRTPPLQSAGELGYLNTGLSWETLRLYVTGGEVNGKERDRELLSYVQSGTFDAANYTSVPLHASSPPPATTPAPIPLAAGAINLNTNKRPTLQSLLLGATAVADSDATARANGGSTDPDAASLANAIATNAASAPFALPIDFLSLSQIKSVTNAQTTDFNREILARRTANVLGTQSTRFTVYALGEARDKVGANFVTTSTVNLRAEVELQTDANGKPVPKVLNTAYYLSN